MGVYRNAIKNYGKVPFIRYNMVKQVFKGAVFRLIKSVIYVTDLPSANHAKIDTEKVRWRQPLNIWVPDDETNWLWDLFVLVVSSSRHGARYIPPSLRFQSRGKLKRRCIYIGKSRAMTSRKIRSNPNQSKMVDSERKMRFLVKEMVSYSHKNDTYELKWYGKFNPIYYFMILKRNGGDTFFFNEINAWQNGSPGVVYNPTDIACSHKILGKVTSKGAAPLQ